MRGTPIERFNAKWGLTLDGCWQWTAAASPTGYGHFWNGERVVAAHRWAYEYFVGPIPEGLEIDHLCRNRSCVNPQHLDPVLHVANVRRSGIDGRSEQHCRNGHEFTSENTYTHERTGYRQCRACRAVHSRYRKKVTP